jgi:predicted O-methyltransferase YrrM
MKILETGSGNSSIFFLLNAPSELYSIDPSPEIFARIKDYCRQSNIDLTNFTPVTERSEEFLPEFARNHAKHFDFILIDGDHGWPNVMVDFCYCLKMLAPDALLMIDDIQLHSVRELANLLLEQPEFDAVLKLDKAIVFRRIGNMDTMPGWGLQPYIERMSTTQPKKKSLLDLFR